MKWKKGFEKEFMEVMRLVEGNGGATDSRKWKGRRKKGAGHCLNVRGRVPGTAGRESMQGHPHSTVAVERARRLRLSVRTG